MEDKNKLSFMAIDPYVVMEIPNSEERESRKDYISNGTGDDWPNFVYSLYEECPIFQSIVNGSADFCVGNDTRCTVMERPNKTESWYEFFGHLYADFFLQGGAYINVVRNKKGDPAEFYWLDYRFVRSDKDNEIFYYSEEYGKKWGRTSKALKLPKYVKDALTEPSSVIFIKNKHSRGTYATPIWKAALKSILTEIAIDEYHYSEINNNFAGSAVINFNGINPTDQEKKEIEKNIREKFTGPKNGARFVLSFNETKDNQTTIARIQSDNLDERYQSLAKKTQQQIFTAFGASANLFGVSTDNKGFSEEEYDEAFRLYNRSRIAVVQRQFCDVFDRVLGVQGSIEITPISVDDNKTVENVIN